jgi:hypothetical protein
MHIEILLILSAANLKRPLDSSVLLLETDRGLSLPRANLDSFHTCMQEAAHLLRTYTNIEAWTNGRGWVPLVQKKIQDDPQRTEEHERCIGIPYIGYIPEKTPLVNPLAKWIHLQELDNCYKDHKQIITQCLLEQ